MVNRQWGSTHGLTHPDSKGVPKSRLRGLTSGQRQAVKRRQVKKRRASDDATRKTHA